jgi:hypothetical protein
MEEEEEVEEAHGTSCAPHFGDQCIEGAITTTLPCLFSSPTNRDIIIHFPYEHNLFFWSVF